MISLQIRNRQLREIGCYPAESYQTKVGPGDEVFITYMEQEPYMRQSYHATVMDVLDHGWYSFVWLQPAKNSGLGLQCVTVYSDGPQDWGVVEFRITRKVHQPLIPDSDRDGCAWQALERQTRMGRKAKAIK